MRAHRIAVEIAGLLLVGLGVAANEWLLVRFCSSDGVLAPSTKTLIRGFNVTAVSAGLLTLWFRVRISARLRRFSARYGRSLATGLLVSLVTTVLLLAGAEGTCFFLNRQKSASFRDEVIPAQPSLQVEDADLGYKPRANHRITITKRYKGETLYRAVYSIDAHSRRITPGQEGKHAEEVILFFGNSTVFGEGVSDDETMPYYVGQAASGHMVYNYGVMGYGPHQMLARLEGGAVPSEVQEPSGILIYTLNDGQVSRAHGSMRSYTRWAADTPYYRLEGGRLVRKGSFRTGRSWRNIFYEILGRSQILQYRWFDIPLRESEVEADLTFKIITASRDRFRQQFTGGEFYVLRPPSPPWSALSEFMKPMLEERGIRYLDYSRLFEWPNERLQIPHDGHPTPEAHRLIAARLAQDLNLGR